MKHIYNHIKDKPDSRDIKYKIPSPHLVSLPTYVDLSHEIVILDQKTEGSCVSQGCSQVDRVIRIRKGLPNWIGSRNFIYFNGRSLENDVKDDGGLQVRDGLKAILWKGVCDENLWPYNSTTLFKKPTMPVYKAAIIHKNVQYQSVNQDLTSIKSALAAKNMIIIGISVYDSFESDSVNAGSPIPLPNTSTETLLGGHCCVLCGYNDATQMFTLCNSWGESWSNKGFDQIPYNYIANPNLCSDLWILTNAN